MRSIADGFRRDVAEHVNRMSIDERFAMAARLAADDLAAYQSATGMSQERARRELVARRQTGRRYSRVAASFADDRA